MSKNIFHSRNACANFNDLAVTPGAWPTEGLATMSDRSAARVLTPDQRLRVFVSSTLQELAPERAAAQAAIESLRLTPVLFELGARPHPPRTLYRAYLEQSQIFVGIYWQSYGWVAPGLELSGVEEEFRLADGVPRLLYVKEPAPEREPRLRAFLTALADESSCCFKQFTSPEELQRLLAQDLALLISERFASKGSAQSSGLPSPPTSFVGRTIELFQIDTTLVREDVRLLTITGPGGIGKTRLAIEAARRLADRYADGVVFVPLEGVGDVSLVVPAIASAVGLRETGSDPLPALAASLQTRALLLVLDNFEHVVAAAPAIATLLERAAGLTVLVTSREPLRLRGEHTLLVPPLDCEHEGVALFAERSAAARHGFELAPADVPTVTEICRRLDGVPLAIELAAPRLRLLTPRQLLERLRERLPDVAPQDAPVRQQTLEGAIRWSYDLLRADERRLFEQLSTFRGSFDLEAAEAVCEVPPGVDLLELLASLLDKSIVYRLAEPAAVRFAMLGMIRDFACDRLAQSGPPDSARARLASYYLTFAEQHVEEIRAGSPYWLDLFELEHDNFRAALAWFQTIDDGERKLRLASALSFFWYLRGHLIEGRRHLEHALVQDEPLAARGPALRRLSAIASLQGDPETAAKAAEEALEAYIALEDDAGIAMSLVDSANVAVYCEDLATARAKYGLAEDIFRRIGDAGGAAGVLVNLAYAALLDGDGPAVHLCEAAAAQAHDFSRPDVEAFALVNLSFAHVHEGDPDAAAVAAARAAAIAAPLGLKKVLSYCAEAFGATAAARGDGEAAARLLAAACASRIRLGIALHPFEARLDNEARSCARATVGEQTFEAAWREGSELTLDAAVAAGLSSLELEHVSAASN